MMDGSYIKRYVGKRMKMYFSPTARLFGFGVIGLISNYSEGWIEVKKKNEVEHIKVDKIYSFRVLE